MKRSSIFIVVFLLIPFFAVSQNKPVITFNENSFDFGTISESDGPASHTFQFTNTGKVPLVLSNVETSCGCTTPQWSKQPIVPGMKGIIKVEYDPANRPGPFTKTITIKSNAVTPVVTLSIRGNVTPKAEKPEDRYMFKIGDLMLQTNHASFGMVFKGQVKDTTVEVFNPSQKPIKVEFSDVPSHLTAKMEPAVLKPGEKGKILLHYDSNKLNDWDYVIDRLRLKVNDQQPVNNRLTVTSLVREDFSSLTAADMAKAPQVKFNSTTFDFGTITQDNPVEHKFTLTNTGKSNLLIHKVKASCGCTAVSPDKNVIAPGDSTVIKAIFNPAGKMGNQKKSISVITNDPKESRTILWITGTVTGSKK